LTKPIGFWQKKECTFWL